MQEKLTLREQEIYRLLVKGTTAKEIALILGIGYSTVDFHRSNIYRKLGVRHVQELIAKYNEKSEAVFTKQYFKLYVNRWANPKNRSYGELWSSFDRIKFSKIYTGKFTDLIPLKPEGCIKFLISGTVDKRLQWTAFSFFYVTDDKTLPWYERNVYIAGRNNNKFADIGPGEFNKVEIEIKVNDGIDIDELQKKKTGIIQVELMNVIVDCTHDTVLFDSGERIPDDIKNHQVIATVRNFKMEPIL
jgi:DNA-binding CsgD family transcriptional regulator